MINDESPAPHERRTPTQTSSASNRFAFPTTFAASVSNLGLALGLVSTSIIIAGLYFGRDILVPLALALFLGFILDPIVVKLKRLGMPRPLAVMVVVFFTLSAIGGSTFMLAMQVRTLSAELPQYQRNIRVKLRSFNQTLRGPSIFDGAITTIDTVKKEVGVSEKEEKNLKINHSGRVQTQRVQIQEASESPITKVGSWLKLIGGPLGDAGIVLVFMVVVLLDRPDLRDRLLRLLGGNLHRTTDALDEAGKRISKYLTMQLLVNMSYGVPMAIVLGIIGVPGAILWGALAAVMRFVPYIGPMISALFPLALAFAVDPGWSMVFWTLGFIIFLELVSNNLIEPWVYGASTGLSAMSLMVSATFWTLLWGPIGLIISTPLTVCLLVIGRHLPQLRFFEILLGSQPVLDAPTRIYQRLLADDPEEAIELALHHVESDGISGFYAKVGIPALKIACADHNRAATAEHRLRVVSGMERLLLEIEQQSDGLPVSTRPQVVCIGAKWEVDLLAARMITHGLKEIDIAAQVQFIDTEGADFEAKLDLLGARTVCLSHFNPDPQTRIRYLCRHLRRRWPDLHIIGVLWNAPADLVESIGPAGLGLDVIATSFDEVILRVSHQFGAQYAEGFMPAPISDDDLARVRALHAAGVFNEDLRRDFDIAAKRAAEVFDAPVGMVTLIGETTQTICGASLSQSDNSDWGQLSKEDFTLPRELSICDHVIASAASLVIEDIARDPRFAHNPALLAKGIRFYAGTPFSDVDGNVFGSLCILDQKPRVFTERDLRLLEFMAKDLRNLLQQGGRHIAPDVNESPSMDAPSATVAQPVPI